MKRRLFAFLLAIGMICTAAACGKQTPTEESAEQETQETVPLPEAEPEPELIPEEPPEPAGTNPLTGLPMEPELEHNRPIAVMFNNLKAAQPQLGISQADIIYEVPAEGGITRMLGVFQSLDGVETLGSIRSTRPYYLELALGHDALLVHAGGSPDAYKDIRAWGVPNMDGVRGGNDAKIFWRDAERKKRAGYEHSLLTSGEAISAYLEDGPHRTTHQDTYTYAQEFTDDGTPIAGASAVQITVPFSHYKTGIFTFDPDSQQYTASQYGAPYTDGNTGEQPGFTNVLVLNTSIYPVKGDREGRLVVKLTGEGSGTYFCGGKAAPITWSKQDRNSQFVYRLEDGSPLVLGKGASYICIISPKSSSLTYQ